MRCPDCAAEVSPLRDLCPKCGAPTDRLFRERQRSGDGQRSPEELSRNRKAVLATCAGILILMAAMGRIHPLGHLHFPHHRIRITTHSEPKEPVTIGAAQLFEAYHTNSQSADRQFGGREMVVTGEFVRTVPDGYGSIDMRLKTAHPETPLGIDLDKVSVDAATKLEPGQMVTVSCREVAGSGDDPWLQDCVIQPPAPADANVPVAPPPPAPPERH